MNTMRSVPGRSMGFRRPLLRIVNAVDPTKEASRHASDILEDMLDIFCWKALFSDISFLRALCVLEKLQLVTEASTDLQALDKNKTFNRQVATVAPSFTMRTAYRTSTWWRSRWSRRRCWRCYCFPWPLHKVSSSTSIFISWNIIPASCRLSGGGYQETKKVTYYAIPDTYLVRNNSFVRQIYIRCSNLHSEYVLVKVTRCA